uniref:Uncharacterized protein n=1 Tax=Acrobeloides nanus TaxID=290746 RepID=A0A914ER41_9BILA
MSNAKACNMRAASSVCDPYVILTESERYRLNNEMNLMATRTEKIEGDFCDRRGFEPILLIVQEGSQKLVDDINKKWNLDGQCKKAVIFMLSAQDHELKEGRKTSQWCYLK